MCLGVFPKQNIVVIFLVSVFLCLCFLCRVNDSRKKKKNIRVQARAVAGHLYFHISNTQAQSRSSLLWSAVQKIDPRTHFEALLLNRLCYHRLFFTCSHRHTYARTYINLNRSHITLDHVVAAVMRLTRLNFLINMP